MTNGRETFEFVVLELAPWSCSWDPW